MGSNPFLFFFDQFSVGEFEEVLEARGKERQWQKQERYQWFWWIKMGSKLDLTAWFPEPHHSYLFQIAILINIRKVTSFIIPFEYFVYKLSVSIIIKCIIKYYHPHSFSARSPLAYERERERERKSYKYEINT